MTANGRWDIIRRLKG